MTEETATKKPFDPIMYIVVLGDLEMPAGKLAAQAGHAAVNAYVESSQQIHRASVTASWLSNGGAKICVRAESIGELTLTKYECDRLGIPAEIIEDAGHTVFAGPTVTCMGVGPLWRSEAGTLADLPLY
jgi:PTH2 family peptidyl-tRNA hydrolase